MKQQTLEPVQDATAVEAETPSIDHVIEATEEMEALAYLRESGIAIPAARLEAGMNEYDANQLVLRERLKKRLVRGTHYGFPPGCEPTTKEENGKKFWLMKWKDKEGKWRDKWISYEQWTPKEPLYKAGAQYICGLLNLLPICDGDLSLWQQLGSPKGTFVVRCRLFPKGKPHIEENLAGQGHGARRVGQKGGDENNAVKMAGKSACVDAVLNGFALSDLFTQDIHDPEDKGADKEPHVEPGRKKDAPKSKPRTDRVTKEEVQALLDAFKQTREAQGMPADRSALEVYVKDFLGMDGSPTSPSAWMRGDYEKAMQDLKADGEIPY